MEGVEDIINRLNERDDFSDISDKRRNLMQVILFFLSSLKEEELFLMHCLERIMDQEDIDKIQKDFIHYYEKNMKSNLV